MTDLLILDEPKDAIVTGNTFKENTTATGLNYRPVFNLSSAENLSELIKKFIRDELQKSQSLAELGEVVPDRVEEVKKLKPAGK